VDPVQYSMAAPSSPPAAKSGAARFRLRLIFWGRWLLLAAVIAAGATYLFRHGGIETVHRYAQQWNGGLVFALLVVLPLIGFPASELHVAAGIRFGAALGLALVSVSILLQLLASYALVQVWRDTFARWAWLRRVRERIPPGARTSVCVLAVLLPGAPFAAVNYALPLVGVRLRTLLLCAWPLHTLRATVTVAFGDQSSHHLTATRLALLLAYGAAILGASAWTYRRVRAQLEAPRPAAGDPKRRA
jgi:uncharacterized membrane protein YdjX (TVP38/TMEM64 family)